MVTTTSARPTGRAGPRARKQTKFLPLKNSVFSFFFNVLNMRYNTAAAYFCSSLRRSVKVCRTVSTKTNSRRHSLTFVEALFDLFVFPRSSYDEAAGQDKGGQSLLLKFFGWTIPSCLSLQRNTNGIGMSSSGLPRWRQSCPRALFTEHVPTGQSSMQVTNTVFWLQINMFNELNK